MIISMINNLICHFCTDEFEFPSTFPEGPNPMYTKYSIGNTKYTITNTEYTIPKKIYATPNTPNGYLLCLSWICVISGKYFQRNKIWGNLSFVKITSSSGRDFVLFQTNSVYEFSARNRWKFTSSSGRDFSSSSALILIHLSASCNKTSHGLISLTSLGKWDIEKSRKVVSDHYRRKVV